MKDYFKLQYTLIKREVNDAGFPFFVMPLFVIAILFALTALLGRYPSWASYLIALIVAQLLFSLNGNERNDFLKNLYSRKRFVSIRLAENILIALPFLFLLTVYQQWLSLSFVLILVHLFPFLRGNLSTARAMPTPFTRQPFEFIVGIRSSWFTLLITHLVAAISLYVGNSNLTLFCLVVVILICGSFYYFTERELFVWEHSQSPRQFIFMKIKRGILNCSTLLLPIVFAFTFRFPTLVWILLIVYLFALSFICLIVCIKYAAYPRSIGLPEMTVLTFSCLFFPLIITLIPYYYIQATRKLKDYLC